MKTFFIEVTHVDASRDDSNDRMTEWITIEAISEIEAMDQIVRDMLAQGRAPIRQEVI
jgi:hypothetical protein